MDGAPYEGGALECGDYDSICITACAQEENALPVMRRIDIKGGVVLPVPGMTVTYWGREAAEITPHPFIYVPFTPPLLLMCEQIRAGGINHGVSVFSQGKLYYTIETENEIYTGQIPLCAVDDISLNACENDGKTMISLIFCGGGKRYLAVLCYDGDYHPVALCTADYAAVNDNYIVITDNVRDMCRLSVTRTYIMENCKVTLRDRSFVYRDDCIDYPPALLPYLYAESALCRDEDKCNRLYRGDGLSLMQGCKKIAAPPHMQLPLNKIALLRPCNGGYSAQCYDFTTDGMLISGIRRCGF